MRKFAAKIGQLIYGTSSKANDDEGKEEVATILNLRRTHIHTSDSELVRTKLDKFITSSRSCPKRWLNETTIDALKYLARVHGLPSSIQAPLTDEIQQQKDRTHGNWYVLKLVLTLKHATLHNSDFIHLNKLLEIIRQYNCPENAAATEKDFFTREVITQLLLAIVSILNPDRVTLEKITEPMLQELQDFMPYVNVKFKSTIKRSLEKMGYWTGSGTTQFHNLRNRSTGIVRDGEEIIRSAHQQKASKVTAHVVKTQQTQMMTNEENISEKTQMQNISLSNALQNSRSRTKATAQNQQMEISPAKSASGSERWWYRTTSTEITNFLDMAKQKRPISPDDVEYLKDKLTGFKFSFSQDGKQMVAMIAQTFYRISEYQALKDDTILAALDYFLESTDVTSDEDRENILQATARQCTRRKCVPGSIYRKLSNFQNNKHCTSDMRKIIWSMTSMDDNYAEQNLLEAVSLLKSAEHCEQALSYIEKLIMKETRCKEVEKVNLIQALVRVVTEKPMYEEAVEEIPEMNRKLDPIEIVTSGRLWNLIPGRKIYKSIRDHGTVTISHSIMSILGQDLILSANEERTERLKMRKKAQEKAEKLSASSADCFPYNVRLRAAEVIEDYLTMTWTDGLDPHHMDKLIASTMEETSAGDLSSKIIRCILRSLDKNQENPDYFKQFPNINDIFAFLFAISASGLDRKLQVFTLAILANLLNNSEIKLIIVKGLRHVDFLRNQLDRTDVLIPSTGQVVLEEDQDEELRQKIQSVEEEDENEYFCVSMFAAKILLASAEDENIVDESTVSLAAQCLLNNPDKMTKIYCAEYLFKTASGLTKSPDASVFTSAVLNSIQGCTFHSIADVRVYSTAAYCTALAWLTKKDEIIEDHVNFLSNLYSFKKVSLDGHSYNEWINPKILQAFYNISSRDMAFAEQIFQLLTYILNNTCADSKDSKDYGTVEIILSTLKTYCSTGNQARSLPEATMDAVENLLLESDIFDEECARIIEHCMSAGKWVSDSVLEEFSKYLCHPTEIALPFLRRLCLANENQELPDSIFNSFQMELIGLRLFPQVSPKGQDLLAAHDLLKDRDSAQLFRCLKEFTNNGKLLSPLNLAVMTEHLNLKNVEDVIECLTSAAANGQSLPKEPIEISLLKECNPCLRLDFAVAILKRNQELPPIFLHSTFGHFKEANSDLRHKKTLDLIATMIQYNQQLPLDVVEHYCQEILKMSAEHCVKSDHLVPLIHLIRVNVVTDKTTVAWEACRKSFLRAIESGNATLMEIGMRGISTLPKSAIAKEEMDRITAVQLSTNFLMWKVYNSSDDSMNAPSKEQLLNVIEKSFDGHVAFPGAWTTSLESNLTEDPEMSRSILKMLQSKTKVHHIDNSLMEAICYTIVKTKSIQVKENAQLVIGAALNFGFKLTVTCKAHIAELTAKNDVEWRRKVLNETTVADVLLCLQRWCEAPDDPILKSALGRHLESEELCKKYCIEILEKLADLSNENWKNIPQIANVISAAILNDNTTVMTEVYVQPIEAEIQNMDSNLNCKILQAYAKVLLKRPGLAKNKQDCLENLAEILYSNQQHLKRNDRMNIFAVFLSMATNEDLPEDVIDFVILEGIVSQNASIRGKCFQLLLLLRERNTEQWQRIKQECWPTIFYGNLETVYKEIYGPSMETLQFDESKFNLDLMFALHTLKSWDLQSLKKKNKSEWVKHLIISDFIATFATSVDEQLELYPLVRSLCTSVGSIIGCLDVSDSLREYLEEHPGSSVRKILQFILPTFGVGKEKIELFRPMERDWISNLITDGLKEKLIQKFPSISLSMAELTTSHVLNFVNFDTLDTLIEKMADGSSFRLFQELLKLLEENGESTQRILRHFLKQISNEISPSTLRTELQTQLIMSRVPKGFTGYLKLQEHVHELLDRGFSFNDLQTLFSRAQAEPRTSVLTRTEASSETLENVLFQLRQYQVHPHRFPSILASLADTKTCDWIQAVNRLVKEHIFSGSQGVKSAQVILEEAKQLNDKYADKNDPQEQKILILIDRVQKRDFHSKFHPHGLIKTWNQEDVRTWAKKAIQKFSSNYEPVHEDMEVEILAVVNQACFLIKNYCLTPVQLLSILVGVGVSKNGCLLQVATGSGKSTIIAVIAVLHAIIGKSVDVYTSSPVLAERDAREWSAFYTLFRLDCDHNGDKGSGYVRGEKACYKKQIVYGDTSQFQFDTLRDEYSGLQTRAGRQYGCAIVDEVDSMLIDDSSKLARLSSTLPGMDLLQILYHLTWKRLQDVQQRLFAVGASLFYLEGRRSAPQNGRILYEFATEDGTVLYIEDIAQYILENLQAPTELAKARIFTVDNIEAFVANHLKDFLSALIGDKKFDGLEPSVQKLELPKSLVNYARSQINNWVESAMTAVTFEENVHYVVDQGQIKPVDFHTTGIIQSFSNWNNGLHQFLQIKHSLKITTETVTTNFLSNMAMFQKYGNSIVGFSGTLGSKFSQDVLKEVYSVNTNIIPEMHYKRFHRLPDIVVPNHDEWLEKIVHSALHESAKRRSVLIICQTIKTSEQIAEELAKQSKNKVVVKLYIRNDQNQEKEVEQVHQGDIIVATNLAGRGTDIKTEKVEEFGGLHVMVTFLPDSLRVEDQAFGRTARQGNKGTGQLIIIGNGEKTSEIAQLRDEQERKQLEHYKNCQLNKIRIKDKLFQDFCRCYQAIRKRLENTSVSGVNMLSAKTVYKAVSGKDTLGVLEHTVLQAVEELWAIFLKKIDDDTLDIDEAKDAYVAFEQSVKNDFEAGRSILSTENCFYFIQQGNEYFKQDSKLWSSLNEAVQCYEKAIELDADFAPAAYAGKAFALLKGKTHFIASNSHSSGYKVEAVKFLQHALKLLYTEIGIHSTAQMLVQQRTGDTSSDLFHQLTSKVNLVGDYCKSLEAVLSEVQRSQRRVYVTGKASNSIVRMEQADGSKSVPELLNDGPYHLEFTDLTARYDCGTIDQASNTIEAAECYFKEASSGMSSIFTSLAQELFLDGKNGRKEKEERKRSVDIAVEIRYQDLKATSDALSDTVTTYSSLKLDAIADLVDLEKVIKGVSQSRYLLSISADRSCIQNICKIVGNARITYNTEPSADGKTMEFSKGILSTDNLDELVPPDVQVLTLEVGFDSEKDRLNEIKEHLTKATFAITFTNVPSSIIETYWETVFIHFNNNTLRISNMDAEKASKVVARLREKKIGFVLCFENLSREAAEHILDKADRAQEDIEQREIKEMGQQCSSEYVPLDEIRELIQRGVLLMVNFSEKAFVPWWSVASLSIIASVQVAAGGLLVCTGFGATVGMGLITEGMADFTTTYRVYSTRNFNWSDYAIQKAVSLTISAVSMGLSSLKDGAKGATMLVEGAVTETVEQAGTRVIVNGKTLTQAIKTSSSNLRSLACKQIAVQGTETAARIGINAVVDSISKCSFDMVKQNINDEVQRTVRSRFHEDDYREALSYFCAVDSTRRQQLLSAKIDNWLNEITNPQSGNWKQAWDKVGMPLCQGILSDPKYLGSVFSMTTRMIGVIQGCYEIATIVQQVCDAVKEKLDIENKLLTPANIIYFHFKITTKEAQEIVSKMKFGNVKNFDVQSYPTDTDMESYMISLFELKRLFGGLQKSKSDFSFESDSLSRLVKSVVTALTTNIIRIADSKLVSPVTTLAAGKLVAAISQEIQSRYIVSDHELSQDQRKAEEIKKKPVNERTDEEKQFLLRNDRPITVSAAITGNAKDHNIAYQKRDIIATIDSSTPEESSRNDARSVGSKAAKEAVAKILDGAPADISTIFILAKTNKANVKVVDDPNYEPSEAEKDAGVKIIVYQEGPSGAVGHYLLKDARTGEVMDFDDGKGTYDCAYTVLSEITGKSPDELRVEAALFIDSNQDVFSTINESATWIRDRYPEEANRHLQVGGFRRSNDKESRTRDKYYERIKIYAKKNGVIDDEDDGDHVSYSKRKLRLSNLDFSKGTRPQKGSRRKEEAKLINELIKEGGFTYENDPNYNLGKMVVPGHLTNEIVGGEGDDPNMIVKTQSCNGKYNRKFEEPLKEFISRVQEITRAAGNKWGSRAFVEVEHIVPEYKLLTSNAVDPNGNPVLEVPFADQFSVSITLRNNLNPEITKAYHECFSVMHNGSSSAGSSYSCTFTNSGNSEATPGALPRPTQRY